VLEDTTTLAVAVQPFEGSVTVIVYVPAALTVGVAVVAPATIPDPVQLNVAPDVADDPLSVTVFEVHVMICAAPAFASGNPVPEFTAALLVEVQPFEASETVNVYVPAAFTVGVAVVPPETIPGPLQLNVAPEVVEEPFSVTEVPEHVSV
jgi:hypothetical protein